MMAERGATTTSPSVDEVIDLLRQERADFRNYRQRVADERVTDAERIRAELIGPLLPLIDDLDRAFAEVPKHLDDDPWVRGVSSARSRLGPLQGSLGLERVGAVGDMFDPTRHEAVVYEPDADADAATLAAVIQPGYAMHDRLLRPAQVVVRGPILSAEAEPTPDPPTNSEPSDPINEATGA